MNPGEDQGRQGHALAALPTPANRLIGRDADVAAALVVLRDNRLVTLTGPPGVGKTRLALGIAAAAAPEFDRRTLFVDLARVREATAVVPEIARVLGVRDSPGTPLVDRLAEVLADRKTLLVVDNLDHVLDSAAELARLLSACPELHLLATSRERLRLAAEREVAVAPLELPGAADRGAPDRLARNPCVALLSERAGKPGLTRPGGDLDAVAEICVRLDGLPLAIELAAARLKVFSPRELVTRLEDRLALLTDGARDVPERQRALRRAIEWSHDLLPARERILFRRLSVFTGGWTLSAAEEVCAAPDVEVLDGLGSLLDKSLVLRSTRADGTAAFSMLESLREFAAEQLAQFEEATATRARHAAYYVERAAAVRVATTGTEEAAAHTWISEEHGNLGAALVDRRAAGDLVSALTLASALGWSWYTRGYLGEGQTVLGELLSSAGASTVPEHTLVDALVSFGFLAGARGDLDEAEEALTRARAIAGRTGDRRVLATSSLCLGNVAKGRGRYDEAAAHYHEAARTFAELGHGQGEMWAEQDLGMLALESGDLSGAEGLLRENLARARAADYPWAQAWAAWGLATVLLSRESVREASVVVAEALAIFDAMHDDRGVAQCLEACAQVAGAQGSYLPAARLLGAAGTLRQALAATSFGAERHQREKLEAAIPRAVGPDAAERARQVGRTMSLAAAVELAQSQLVPATPAETAPAAALTAREREVAALVAAGSTNRQIGRGLGITEKTAEVHVRNIMAKLRVASRASISAWAVANGLHRPSP